MSLVGPTKVKGCKSLLWNESYLVLKINCSNESSILSGTLSLKTSTGPPSCLHMDNHLYTILYYTILYYIHLYIDEFSCHRSLQMQL